MDGLTGIQEDTATAYCAVSLTYTPEKLKQKILQEQQTLKTILSNCEITAYDPASAPYSPDIDKTSTPEEIYKIDKAKLISSRFFVSYDILPSTGQGVEYEVARRYNRMMVIIHNTKIRTSRMQVNRAIHIQVDDLEKDAGTIEELIRFLKRYTPAIGIQGKTPVLLGFAENDYINLEAEVQKKFPHLTYTYNPDAELMRM
jgi:hypothetical protein